MAIRYGRLGGNWSAPGAWSASPGSGGTPGASDTAPLATGDAVVLNSNSSGTFTIDTAISILSLDTTGFTGTLVQNAVTLSVSGPGNAWTVVTGMTYAPVSSSRVVQFTNTSGTTVNIDNGGKNFGGLTINGAGGVFSLVRDTTVIAGGVLTLTAGHLNANNKNVSTGFFSSSNSNTRVLTMGTGTWTLTANQGSILDCTTSTGLTVNPDTARIVSSLTAGGGRNINSGGKSWPVIAIANTGAVSTAVAFAGGGTWKNIEVTAPILMTFLGGTTTTITDSFDWSGTGAKIIQIETSATAGTAAILACSNPCTINWAAMRGIQWNGPGLLNATNTVNLMGNTGGSLSITPPTNPIYQMGI